MIVRVNVYKEGIGNSPLTLADTKKVFKSFKVECKDEDDVNELISFVEAGVNAYEDEKAESIDNEGYVIE